MAQQVQILVNNDYTTKEGDTLSSIAQRAYNNGSQPFQMAIYRMNQQAIGNNPGAITPGKSLWIPTIAQPPQTNTVYIVQPGDTLSDIAQQTYKSGLELYRKAIYRMNQHTIGNNPDVIQPGDPLYLPPISNPSPQVNTFYIRQKGDTFKSIAQQVYNNEQEWKLISNSKLSEQGSKAGTILFIPFSQQVPGGVNIHPPDNWP